MNIVTPYPFLSVLPLILLTIPLILVNLFLAKEKGKNVLLWTLLSILPIFNKKILAYLVGAKNKVLEEKIDKIMEKLEKLENR